MTLYVSRHFDVPPLTAAALFDEATGAGQVRAGRAQLELLGAGGPVERRWPLSPYRVVPARLRYPNRRAGVAVELEVGVWSKHAVELGIRPVGRMGAVEPYAEAGHAVLAALTRSMHALLDIDIEAAVEAIFVHPALRPRPAPPRP
jgi:hypothetical protein